MQIDWPSFTPMAALAGGVLIGAASALYLLLAGRIAGITGILAGPLAALAQRRPLALQRPQLLFLVGLLAAPLVWRLFAPLPEARLSAGTGVLVAAGLLVGVGTRLANGCTSGHGVCGLARLSLRSLANVCHGVRGAPRAGGLNMDRTLKALAPLLAGLVFGIGLIAAGMTDPAKVLAFLDLAGAWDPSLALVMGGAIAVALVPFGWAKRQRRTLMGEPVQWPTARGIDARLLGGGALFGIGWGLAGLCPGPAIVALAAGLEGVWVFVLAMLAGLLLVDLVDARR